MKKEIKFLIGLGFIILITSLIFSFSDTLESILFSFIFGIFIFILFILISNSISKKRESKKHKGKALEKRLKKSEKKNYIFGFIIFLIMVVLFLNFYLSFRALLGNDLLISLQLDEESFVLKNGEISNLTVKTSIFTNPFCKADCSLVFLDLSTGEIISIENSSVKLSKPSSKIYSIGSNAEYFGQKLYKVSLECSMIRNSFCYAGDDSSKVRTKIISLDYGLNEIQEFKKEDLKNKTENLNYQFNFLQSNLNNLKLNYSYLDLSEFENELLNLTNLSSSFQDEITELNNLFKAQSYIYLENNLSLVQEDFLNFEENFSRFNSSVFNAIQTYNFLVEDIELMYDETVYFENSNFSNESILLATSFVQDFNAMVLEFFEYNNISNKINLFNEFSLKKEELLVFLKNETLNNVTLENQLNISFLQFNFKKILMNVSENQPPFILDEPSPICGLDNTFYECINNASINYPIIFVHGHSFNERISAELSMESFGGMTRALEEEGYIDAGYFYGSKYDNISEGYLGKINKSVVVKATYYLDTLVTDEGSFIFDSKWENIDIYAGRLNEIILNVKYLTGKDKVIVVAHSMGGLVTRRYMQLYGEGSLEIVHLC